MKNSKLKIKVCGMRDTLNIADLMTVHPDFIGFIFHELSPRNCKLPPRLTIPKSVRKVGVFVDKPLDYILFKKEEFGLDFIQLHGNESPDFCREVQYKAAPVIKAFRVDARFDFKILNAYEPVCNLFLFDAAGPKAGGNGLRFNWDLLKAYKGETPFLLSGGIDKSMAIAVKNFKHPAFLGVDINSGFEMSPGMKNITNIKQFTDELSA